MSHTATHAVIAPVETEPQAEASGWMIRAGMVAGPVWVAIAALQALTREGFDLTRHPISVLSNGDLGWIQIASFVACGVLLIVAGRGLREDIAAGPGSRWVPRLVTLVGIGMVASGVFVADPLDGFPEGTPLGRPDQLSWHGGLHYLFSSLSFACLIALAFVIARRAKAQQDHGLARLSVSCAVALLLTWGAVMAAPDSDLATATFTAAIAVILCWSSLVFRRTT